MTESSMNNFGAFHKRCQSSFRPNVRQILGHKMKSLSSKKHELRKRSSPSKNVGFSKARPKSGTQFSPQHEIDSDKHSKNSSFSLQRRIEHVELGDLNAMSDVQVQMTKKYEQNSTKTCESNQKKLRSSKSHILNSIQRQYSNQCLNNSREAYGDDTFMKIKKMKSSGVINESSSRIDENCTSNSKPLRIQTHNLSQSFKKALSNKSYVGNQGTSSLNGGVDDTQSVSVLSNNRQRRTQFHRMLTAGKYE